MIPTQRQRAAFCLTAAAALTACQAETSSLNPQGEGAAHIATLWIIMLFIATIIFLQVMALFAFALFRRRQKNAPDAPNIQPPSRRSTWFVIANGMVIPSIILTVVLIFNLITLARLSSTANAAALTIEVVGHRWWWEVRYPDHGFVTANEIHIPTGTHVELRLSSADVIHSLWIPALNGKADMIPGYNNRMTLHTDVPGIYQGICAELCGVQHARMRFLVIATPPEAFTEWIAVQQQPAPPPQDEMTTWGQQIFLGSACVYCHAVRGTSASGIIGPDLTHFASRLTIGAGAVENTRGNLAGWIIDPHSIKPGNLMPPMYLEGDALQALLTYMETLQ